VGRCRVAAKDDRPYAVLDRMLRDREGRQLLAQAIVDLRAGRSSMIRFKPGTEDPETFLGTGEPASWTGEMLRECSPTAHQAVTKAAPTEADLIRKLTAVIDGDRGAKELVAELEQVPGVRRYGLSKILAGQIKATIADLAERLGYLMRTHDGHFSRDGATAHAPHHDPD